MTTESPWRAVLPRDVVIVAGTFLARSSVRARAFARGLAAAGHNVTVVCARQEETGESGGDVRVVAAPWLDPIASARRIGLARTALGRSRALVEPSGTRLQPSPLLKLGIRLALPDLYATWIPFAIRALRRVLRPNTVVISTGPVSGHVVTRLVRDVQPWIADINDLWSGNPHWPAGRVRGAIDRRLERTTLRAATRITTVNDRMAAELRSRYGDLPVAVIRNGFDPAEFSADDAATGDGPAQLVFAGTLYPDFDLSPLFQAVAEGQRAGRLTPDRLLLAFVGWGTQRAALVARRFGVDEFVESYGAVPRAELLIRLRRATALLLPLYERDPYSLPSRLFEYIGAARPVIALGPTGGVAAELVRNEGIGVIVTTSDEAASILDELIAAPDGLPHADAETRATFTWDASIRYLAELVATVGELPRAPITGGET